MTKQTMKKIPILLLALAAMPATAQRTETTLNEGWEFAKGDSGQWNEVRVPHDWAIYGPFDRANDLQVTAVKQNGETRESLKTGRTGGLPFIGRGAYRTNVNIADTAQRSITLVFDGAMSNAHVRVNGKEVAFWPYGYNSFHVSLDSVMRPGDNSVEVELENFEHQSRWYPGAGLYRNVHLVNTHRVHIPVWGTYVTTPRVGEDYASVKLQMRIDGARKKEKVDVSTVILDPQGTEVASDRSTYHAHGQDFTQSFLVNSPELWSPESPALYTARTTLSLGGKVVDEYDTRFGIRSLDYVPEKGFFLNGVPTKFKGVCNHHDLGP
ncbi:MAG: beta-galactosidase, partial [Duncaniella sp.]|nr:beta-galactosidase [Duncaniella sp.]